MELFKNPFVGLEGSKMSNAIMSEVFYIIIGLIFILVALKALRDGNMENRMITAAFWFVLAGTFIIGPYLASWITGLMVILIAILSAMKGGVKQSKSDLASPEETRANANKIGYKVFIPALFLAITAFTVATFTEISANNAIGVSAVVSLVVALIITKSTSSVAVREGTRLMDNVGSSGILPQVLAALGLVFTVAGVGDVIASGVTHIIPEQNKLIPVIVYCVAMALFTIIMGNGFAAFSVITVGVGIPFLIMQGANPVVVGALGLTAGYCGTLCTPMAGNFNIMPAALLETKDKYVIIKSQLPMALTMLLIHIIIMYTFAF